MIKRIPALLVAAFLVSGLCFGTAQLHASQATDCYALGYHGPCTTQTDCEVLCLELIPENGGAGICFLIVRCCRCATK